MLVNSPIRKQREITIKVVADFKSKVKDMTTMLFRGHNRKLPNCTPRDEDSLRQQKAITTTLLMSTIPERHRKDEALCH